ncbi:hypothetical protein SERLA73DRAFT_157725 [Serpula lacrymans var. lacrymans S7.3]|uniref:Radical SAM core domain-containing protein n=2 Tax=Serpula lacrymans var. lacrymans TaxID=341189 RepID=F8PFY6_SERL3|nr:uncharacterized protein SERLADRAFT_359008 [Serpula lacrymans var. lacrymans S7.9]EGO04798.1 hypothetical protein SERLA73DRAFT_157725 [Serpula lacrymans var. lacrymans S7.3]EGO30629.1 hypothetical protein SERLADRAFT_359008 [Serpula lacrymans var. lacrymans S7.9]
MNYKDGLHSVQGVVRGIRHSLRAKHYSEQTVLDTTARAQLKISQIDSRTPISPSLIDSFHRRHDYLRISLTERCNLRCFYCMPNEGVELSPPQHLLTDSEVIRLATLFVKGGVTKIRLTGGEPTIRKGIIEIIGRLDELRVHGLKSIGMTTNGLILHRRLPEFVANGLTHINLSLDTMDPFKFEIMTRRRGHEAVLRSLEAALLSPDLVSVKLNVVVMKGLNDHEVVDFVEMTKGHNLSVRFIEFMPFTGNKWDKAKMVPSSELLANIANRYPDIARAPGKINDTARSWKIPGYRGSIGFISSMSDHFCASCNRLRLTADGQIKVCLFDAKEISLRDEMRGGASDTELLQLISSAVRGKKEKHAGMEDIDVVTNRPMTLIGGVISDKRKLPTLSSLRKKHMLPYFSLSSVTSSYHIHCRMNSSVASDPISPLTHIDVTGRPCMVDVGDKQPSKRIAAATGRIYIPKTAYDLVSPSNPNGSDSNISVGYESTMVKARSKGDVLTVAQLAAMMGCKRTADLIPLCHPLSLSHISVTLAVESHNRDGLLPQRHQVVDNVSYSIKCDATVSCEGKTGVEMEALTAVSVGLLTVWDMLKAVAGKEMMIGDICVTHKEGGKGDNFERQYKGNKSS